MQAAMMALEATTERYAGLGFALGPDGSGNYWQGIDLDGITARPELAALAEELPGYRELSPSGAGVHAWGLGKAFAALGANASGIEAYSAGRYFTVTGSALGGDLEDLAPFVTGVLVPRHSPVQGGPRPVLAETIADGARNATLYRLGCSLRAKGLTPNAVLAALREENAERCAPPLEEAEVETIARSAGSKPAGHSAAWDAARPPRVSGGASPSMESESARPTQLPQDILTAAIARQQEDPGACFSEDAKTAWRAIHSDTAEYLRLRLLAKAAGASMAEIDTAIRWKEPRKPSAPHKMPSAPVIDAGLKCPHFRPLGHHRGTYYILLSRARQVSGLTARQLGSKPELFALAPRAWWEEHFAGEGGFRASAIDAATDWIMTSCYERGIFVQDRLRGRGAWWDDGRVVMHAGDRLIVDGEVVALEGMHSRYVYEGLPSLPVSDIALSAEDSKSFLAICKRANWEKPQYGWMLAGWHVCALVGGALEWRPHLWQTGASGSGKSWVCTHIVSRALNGFALQFVSAESTAAGVRQSLAQDSLPVIIDESEGHTARQAEQIQGVLSLARQASSDGAGAIVKGGQHGTATAYSVTSCFLFSSIVPQLRDTADESRISVISLTRPGGGDASRAAFAGLREDAASLIDAAFAARLHRLALNHVAILRTNARLLAQGLAQHIGSQRHADQIAALMAGALVLSHPGKTLSAEDADRLAAAQDVTEAREVAAGRDEERLLAHILEAIVDVIPVQGATLRWSVMETARRAAGNDVATFGVGEKEASAALGRVGIKVAHGVLFVSDSHRGIKAMLRDTPWATGWRRVLLRLPGAEAKAGARIDGAIYRVVAVPMIFG